ncbi:MAG: hypothetical protein U9N52_09405 [Campylobacterota bacterium]|nr:hypothetical protein [Campylobacterota bacterium]
MKTHIKLSTIFLSFIALFSVMIVTAGCGEESSAIDSNATLVGEWRSTKSWGAKIGTPDTHGTETSESGTLIANDGGMINLIITEESSDGKSFLAERCSSVACEKVAGVLKSNGKILMIDEDGYLEGELIGESMELCYLETGGDFQLAVCSLYMKE